MFDVPIPATYCLFCCCFKSGTRGTCMLTSLGPHRRVRLRRRQSSFDEGKKTIIFPLNDRLGSNVGYVIFFFLRINFHHNCV